MTTQTPQDRTVVKAVSKKLKYYFEIKRREDGFDLSAAECPRLDHPPIRARPTLQYERLRDRALKHYFQDTDMKTTLTQFNTSENSKDDEKRIKRLLKQYMDKYHYTDPPVQKPTSLPDHYYLFNHNTLTGSRRSLKPEAIGHGSPLQVHSKKTASYPVLRMVPPPNITKGEARRLINATSQLLVATDNTSAGRSRTPRSSSHSRSDGTESYTSSRPSSAKYEEKGRWKYDINGRRYYEKTARPASPPEPSPYYDIHGRNVTEKQVPTWLQKQMGKDKESHPRLTKRPSSAPRPLSSSGHKKASRNERSSRSRSRRAIRVQDLPPEKQPTAWDMQICEPPDTTDPLLLNQTTEHDIGRTDAHTHQDSWKREEKENEKTEKEECVACTQLDESVTKATEASDETVTPRRRDERLQAADLPMNVVLSGERCLYRVSVATGDKPGAGTRAPVHIVLIGELGRTSKFILEKSSTHKVLFQRNQVDVFELDAHYVGPLLAVAIGHEQNNSADDSCSWYLENVLVDDTSRCRCYTFVCQHWLSVRSQDGKTVREVGVTMVKSYKQPERKVSLDDQNNNWARQPYVKIERVEKEKEEKDEISKVLESSGDEGETLHKVQAPAPQYEESPFHTSTATNAGSDRAAIRSPSASGSSSTFTSPRSSVVSHNDDFFSSGVKGQDFSAALRANEMNSERPRTSIGARGEGRKPVKRSESSSSASSQAVSKGPTADLGILHRGSIHDAAKTGDMELTKAWINRKPESIRWGDDHGWTALHVASSNGNTLIVQWLVSHNAHLNTTTPTGYSAIHLAAMNGHTDTMIALADLGAPMDGLTVERQTPLHLSAMKGDLPGAKWLVNNGADLEATDLMGRTPLDIAEQYNHNRLVDFLRISEREQRFSGRTSPSERQPNGQPDDTLTLESGRSSRTASLSDDEIPERHAHWDQNEEDLSGGEELTPRTKKRHEEEVEERRKVYDDQHTKMEREGTSFLDQIRREMEENGD